jgi:4-amino-4-deoxy-L-arabinose transferase-like glycosyltransferase
MSSGRIIPSIAWPEERVLAVALILFFIAWAGYGSITEANVSLHHDVLEAYAWGREFKLGYNQHGPFWAWIAGFWFYVFPHTNTSFVLLAVLNATLGLLGAYRLIGLFAQGRDRQTATLLLLATPFYTFLSFRYNANTIFLSLWPWTLFFFVRSLDKMEWRDTICFAILAAFCMLSKYYTIVLLGTCAFSLFLHDNGLKYVRSPLPYLAVAIFFLLLIPHLVWLIVSDAPPVAYALGLTGRGHLHSLHNSAILIPSAGLYHCFVLGIILLSKYFPKAETAGAPVRLMTPSRRNFLGALVIAPLLLTAAFAISLQVKVSTNMMVGAFPLLPVFLMQLAAPFDGARCFRYSARLAIAVTAGAFIAAPFVAAITGQISRDPMFLEPRRDLAERVTALWHEETGSPLGIAGGPTQYANAISFYSGDKPSSFVDLSFAKAPWVTPEKISQYGLLIACPHDDVACQTKAASFLSGSWKHIVMRVANSNGRESAEDTTFDTFVVPPLRTP